MLLKTPAPLLGHLRRASRRFGMRRLPPGGLRWLACFGVIATVLVVRNAYVFTTKIYEDSDFAADSIAVLQAKHFQLLTGNYSRLGFYHPGPALLYVMAWGEWLFRDVAHLVPTPWNGQLLGILLLNAALLATALSVFARDGGTVVAMACLCTVVAFIVLHPLSVNSNWMPYAYFAPTLLLLVSGAAVAAGRTRTVPLLSLAAGLCIHGDAAFLLFAPVIVLAALTGLFAPHWRHPGVVFRASPRHWFAGLAIALLMALPIVLNTIINWPGELPLYLAYARQASQSLHHTVGVGIGYLLRFWWPGGPVRGEHPPEQRIAAAGGILLTLLALGLARACPHPGQRRFLRWTLVMAVVMSVLFAYYAWRDIDEIFSAYEGYFYWSVPLLVLLAAAAGAAARIPPSAGRVVIPALTAMTAAAAIAASVVPLPPDDPWGPGQYFGDPGMPHDVAVLAEASRGRPIVIDFDRPAWYDAVGVIAYADRNGLRACITQKYWEVLFRAQSMCTQSEIRDGTHFEFIGNGVRPLPPGRPLVVMPSSFVFPEQRLNPPRNASPMGAAMS